MPRFIGTDQESGWLVSSILRDRGKSERAIEVFLEEAAAMPPYEPPSTAEFDQMVRMIETRRAACGFESTIDALHAWKNDSSLGRSRLLDVGYRHC